MFIDSDLRWLQRGRKARTKNSGPLSRKVVFRLFMININVEVVRSAMERAHLPSLPGKREAGKSQHPPYVPLLHVVALETTARPHVCLARSRSGMCRFHPPWRDVMYNVYLPVSERG